MEGGECKALSLLLYCGAVARDPHATLLTGPQASSGTMRKIILVFGELLCDTGQIWGSYELRIEEGKQRMPPNSGASDQLQTTIV